MFADYQEARSTAYHESGHCVVALTLGIQVQRIAIAPACDKRYAGSCSSIRSGDDFAHIACALAGFIAQRRFDAKADDRTGYDQAEIRQILSSRYGRCVVELGAPIVRAAQAEAEKIIARRWAEIVALASELVERFEIEEKEIRAIVGRTATDRINKEIAELEGSI